MITYGVLFEAALNSSSLMGRKPRQAIQTLFSGGVDFGLLLQVNTKIYIINQDALKYR